MVDPTNSGPSPWSGSRSVKEKNAVRKAVTALLDELAPERALKRAEELKGPVEQYRTPDGCVLQAATAAVSVSWFAPADSENSPGELRIIVWKGQVARRGSPRMPKGATIVTEITLHPIEPSSDDCLWKTDSGKKYDTLALAAHCLEILAKQSAADDD